MQIASQWHGLTSYSAGSELMHRAEVRALQSGTGTLLGFEFESTVTLGLRANPDSDLVTEAVELERSGFRVHAVDRGGEATLHSPGQMVIYPVINLKRLGLGVRDFVRLLEDVTTKTLAVYGVSASKGPCESGVFTKRGKIAFIGLRIRKGVSTHGIALNIDNDLSLFKSIKSCGKALRAHDSLGCWQTNLKISDVYRAWCEQFLSSLPLTASEPHGLSSDPIVGL